MHLNQIRYVQPDLSPPGTDAAEIPMLLLYVPTEETPSNGVDNETIKGILSFVYDNIYGDSFIENGRQNEQYMKYLGELKERVFKDSLVKDKA